MGTLRLWSADETTTKAIGAAVAGLLDPGDVVGLAGDLGAGKTRLVQGAADALGVSRATAFRTESASSFASAICCPVHGSERPRTVSRHLSNDLRGERRTPSPSVTAIALLCVRDTMSVASSSARAWP